ncbi:hypothetical protein SKAU_G00185550 [Synaphobranchus kaupii]|uniref:Uncharacterized protein n=1 Tax=Synaphobranchus kaupii TaxID=118154 RepID=A0A9Q1FCP5_SYNKA|nr:hypothetical protein SKAU_G00185550 [Synaphobranchus kaupii]
MEDSLAITSDNRRKKTKQSRASKIMTSQVSRVSVSCSPAGGTLAPSQLKRVRQPRWGRPNQRSGGGSPNGQGLLRRNGTVPSRLQALSRVPCVFEKRTCAPFEPKHTDSGCVPA